MVDPERDIASFTLRFIQQRWRDTSGEPKVRWRGIIQHIQSNDETTFTDFVEALEFIQSHLAQLTIDATSDDSKPEQEKFLNESLKIWEQFASSYSEMMFSTLQQSMKQSEAFKKQVEKAAANAFSITETPDQHDFDRIVSAVKELQTTIERLANKIDEFNSFNDQF